MKATSLGPEGVRRRADLGIEDSRHLSAQLEIDLLLALRQMMHNVPAAALLAERCYQPLLPLRLPGRHPPAARCLRERIAFRRTTALPGRSDGVLPSFDLRGRSGPLLVDFSERDSESRGSGVQPVPRQDAGAAGGGADAMVGGVEVDPDAVSFGRRSLACWAVSRVSLVQRRAVKSKHARPLIFSPCPCLSVKTRPADLGSVAVLLWHDVGLEVLDGAGEPPTRTCLPGVW